MKCASSLVPTDNPVHETDTDPQNVGIATHDLLRMHVEGREVAEDTITEVCTRERAERAEVAMRFHYGVKAWAEVGKYFDRVGAEEPFEQPMMLRVGDTRYTVILTGRPDLGGSEVTLDFKGGRVWSDPAWQLHGYNYACRRKWGIAVWLIPQRCDVQAAMGRKDFEAAIGEQIALVGKEYNPGRHCGFCPRRDECEARARRLHGVYQLFCGTAGTLAEASDLARAYPMWRQLKSYLDAYDNALECYLDANGTLPLGDGSEVFIRENYQREVDVEKGWPVLSEALSVQQLARVVKLGTTKITEGVKAAVREEYEEQGLKVPRGALKEAVNLVWNKLRDADAVTEKPRRVKAVRKVQEGA
jgi:hypothetical protein